MPLERIYRDISVRDSINLDAFSKVRSSEVSQACYIDFKYGLNNDPKIKLNTNTSGYIPSITYNNTNKAIVFNKTSSTTGSTSIDVTSENPISYKVGSTFKGYISFKIINSSVLVNGSDLAGIGFGGVSTSTSFIDFGGYNFVFNSVGYEFRIRSTNLGSSATLDSIPRSSWTDKLDGTGPSGVTVDFTKPQILFIESRGGRNCRITFGFVIDGKEIEAYTHTDFGSTLLNYTSSLKPVAGLLQGVAEASTTPIFEVYAISASTEDDGKSNNPLEFRFSKTLTTGTLAANVFTRVFAIRKNFTAGRTPGFLKIILQSLKVINTGTVPLYWQLRAVESIPSSGYSAIDSNSFLDIITTASTLATASGYVVALAGFVNAGEVTVTQVPESISNAYPIDEISSSNPTAERGMSLWVTPVSTTTSVTCRVVLNYKELQP